MPNKYTHILEKLNQLSQKHRTSDFPATLTLAELTGYLDTQEQKEKQRPFTLWLTGLSGAGKSTIAEELQFQLREEGTDVELLDGDVIRTHISKGLGFSKEGRDTNIRRIGWVCQTLNKHGASVIVAAISPYRDVRNEVSHMIPNFIECYVQCPLDVLIDRDVKGLYAKAQSGEIKNFTGISDPYEWPLNPEITVQTNKETIDESVNIVLGVINV